jgi:hypothetical protein
VTTRYDQASRKMERSFAAYPRRSHPAEPPDGWAKQVARFEDDNRILVRVLLKEQLDLLLHLLGFEQGERVENSEVSQ